MNNAEIAKTENSLTPAEDNSAFLAQLYGDASGLTGSFAEMPYAQDAFLLGTSVAGTSHMEKMPELFAALSVGDKVSLIREPENEHDNRAIRVETNSGDKLGYVPRGYNLILSRLMDAGYFLYGKVRLLEINNEKFYNIVIKIYISFSEYGVRNDELLKLSEDEFDRSNPRPDLIQKPDASQPLPNDNIAEALYNKAVEFDTNGKIAEAEEKVRAAISMSPDTSRYHNLLGIILMRSSNFKQSAEEFRTAFTLDSRNAAPLYNMALLSHAMGENAAAAKMLDSALSLSPDDSDILYARSAIMFDNLETFFAIDGKEKVSREIMDGLRRALKMHPENPEYREMLAVASLSFKEPYKVNYTLNFKK